MKDLALRYLLKNEIKHIGMIECIRYDEIEYLYCAEDGVFLYDKDAELYMLATDGEEVCKKALEACPKLYLLVCHNQYEYDVASVKYGLFGLNKCHQVVWTSKKKLPTTGVCEVRRLEPTDENIDFVFEHYTLAFAREHIADMMQSLGIYGAYYQGKLVGCIGRHEERSLGLLEVLPEYRRMGIATELESHLVNELIDNGEVPYGHIIYGNDNSVIMHKNLGYTFSDTPVFWIFPKK